MHYARAADWATGIVTVKYHYSKHSCAKNEEFGRLYATTESRYSQESRPVSLQSFPSWIRAALAAKYYLDVDMINAHPSILLSLCKQLSNINDGALKNKFECTQLTFYCQHREQVLNLVAKYLSLPLEVLDRQSGINQATAARKECKKFLIALLFGSNIER